MELPIYFTTGDTNLKNYSGGDYYIYELPPYLTPKENFNNCDTNVFEFCIVMTDINWVILKF